MIINLQWKFICNQPASSRTITPVTKGIKHSTQGLYVEKSLTTALWAMEETSCHILSRLVAVETNVTQYCRWSLLRSGSAPVVSAPVLSGHPSQGNWIVPRAKMPQSPINHYFLAQQLDGHIANHSGRPWDRPLIYLLQGHGWLSGQPVFQRLKYKGILLPFSPGKYSCGSIHMGAHAISIQWC